MIDVERWIAAVKLKPFHLLAIACVCFTTVLLPPFWAAKLGIAGIRPELSPVLGLIGIAAGVVWSLHALSWLGGWARGRVTRAKRRRQIAAELKALSPGEWTPILYCVDRAQKTILGPMIDGNARALVNKGLLRDATSVGNRLEWPYTIEDDVWHCLHQRP